MAKSIAMWFGVILLIVGVLGFLSNPILGLFASDSLHNLVYVVFGLIMIWSAKKGSAAGVLKTFGIIYILIAIFGFIGGSSVLGFLATNGAHNWLSLIFGLIFAWAGFMGKGGNNMSSQPMM